MTGPALRSDVVGSLLRPPDLLEARRRHRRGQLSDAAFKAREDRAVRAVLARQEEAGVAVVTDGELRRLSFQSHLVAAVDGFGDWDLDAFLWGDWRGDDDAGDRRVARPDLAVVGPLRRRRGLAVEEFVFVRDRTDRQIKVTLPSPSLFASFYDPQRAPDAYPDLASLLDDVAGILVDEVAELARLGCTYVQLDAPHYTMFLDPEYRDWYAGRGLGAERWLARAVDLDNRVLRSQPELLTGFHLCRGNQGSRWLVEGDYGPLAEQVLARVAADRLLLEYDDARSGGFSPLAAVPDATVVVLGLVTTKTGRMEHPDELLGRIDEAAAHHPAERLAVSPQCGFGTSVVGNTLTEDEQFAKLALVAEVADRYWR